MNFNTRDLVLALLCAFLGSVKGLLVSKVKSLGPIEIFGLRSLGATCLIIPIIIFWNYKLWYDYKSNLILLARSIVGNIAVCSYYFGFAYLPIAEASLLFYSTPVFTIFIGCIFLKEKCGLSEMVSVIFSLLGIILVCFPDFTFDSARGTTDTFKGVAGSIIGAIAQAVALAVVRKITFIPPAVVSFWWALVGIPFSAALNSLHTGRLHSWECGMEAWILILIAVIGFVSELCLVAALKSTDAVIVSIALTSEILWAFILQIYVNNEWPEFWCILGGMAIVFSISLSPIVTCISSKKSKFDVGNEQSENVTN
ncbi:solute carrier family 35 member G1-like [Argiope bruennichi]|uniref:Solute carrier family 35 member G1 like protein n=1 Tax=Argiope bruennichi TaxID=94029 RepID=A0A8T0EWY8_ARGBR|nr:solute carrier family 35 member G1-like [Argiope bruennichi]KAF8782865.1 Solute carrier family 35 member G1 like protein [Argiope bruennichi]